MRGFIPELWVDSTALRTSGNVQLSLAAQALASQRSVSVGDPELEPAYRARPDTPHVHRGREHTEHHCRHADGQEHRRGGDEGEDAFYCDRYQHEKHHRPENPNLQPAVFDLNR